MKLEGLPLRKDNVLIVYESVRMLYEKLVPPTAVRVIPLPLIDAKVLFDPGTNKPSLKTTLGILVGVGVGVAVGSGEP
jgi:hypothetical protein